MIPPRKMEITSIQKINLGVSSIWHPDLESNQEWKIRSLLLYPFNYRGSLLLYNETPAMSSKNIYLQASGQEFSGEQLQGSQVQFSHSQFGLVQTDIDHLLPITN